MKHLSFLYLACILLLLLPSALSRQRSKQSAKKKNVLLLIADDLRPQLNMAYGHDFMVTPELDKLAKESLIFDAAFANFAICAASMCSHLKTLLFHDIYLACPSL